MTTDVADRPSTEGTTPAATQLQTPDAKQTTPEAAQTTPKDAGTAVEDTRNERAKDAPTELAAPSGDKPADDTPEPEAPRYTQAYIDAALEADREETRAVTREEVTNAQKERRQQVVSLVQSASDGNVPLVRMARQMLSEPFTLDGIPTTLPPTTINAMVERVQATVDHAVEGSLALASKGYEDAINGILKTDGARESFWKRARGLDPALSAGEILPMLVEELALDAKSLRGADLDTLTGRSAKAKKELIQRLEDAEQAGITKGLRSKVTGGDGSSGRAGGSSLGTTSYDDYMSMTAHERAAMKPDDVKRVIAEGQRRKRAR